MSNVHPPNGLQTIIGQEEPYGVFQQFLDSDGSWKWVRGPEGTTDLTWAPDGTITLTTSGGMPQTVRVDLTSDQLATLTSNPPVFVPAPGAGKVLAFLAAYALTNPGSIPFNTLNTYISYADDTNNTLLDNEGLELASGMDVYYTQDPPAGVQQNSGLVVENKAFVAANPSSDDPSGAILASALNSGGNGYVGGDTFTVDGGGFPAAIGVVDIASPLIGGTFPMIAADEATPSFTVAGDRTLDFPPAGSFTVIGASTPPAAVDLVDSNDSSSTTGTFTLTSGNTAGDLGFSVDGSSSVSIPTAANLQTSTITVTAWIRAHGGVWPADGSILANFNAATTTGWFFRLVNGKINAYVFPANAAANSSAAVSTSGYHHVAMSYDGTIVKAYIDGLPDGTAGAVLGLTPNTTQPIIIGTSNFFSIAFTGDVASPSFYDVALSDGDIATLAAGGTIGTPAISQWTFRKSNNGSYTAASSTFGGVNTVVTTNEPVTNSVADGDLSTVAGGGVVSAYHLTSNGFGYVPAIGVSTTTTSGGGAGLTLDIDSITPATGTAQVWITYTVLNLT